MLQALIANMKNMLGEDLQDSGIPRYEKKGILDKKQNYSYEEQAILWSCIVLGPENQTKRSIIKCAMKISNDYCKLFRLNNRQEYIDFDEAFSCLESRNIIEINNTGLWFNKQLRNLNTIYNVGIDQFAEEDEGYWSNSSDEEDRETEDQDEEDEDQDEEDEDQDEEDEDQDTSSEFSDADSESELLKSSYRPIKMRKCD